MTMQTDLQAAVDKATAASAKLHEVVHGDAVSTVATETGAVKTVAKALADIDDTLLASMAELDQKVFDASSSENNAAASAAVALVSEQNASGSEASAATSALAASTSEANAALSEGGASVSASAAATSEANAAASETNAASSEANASTSAGAAAASETNAAAAEAASAIARTGAETAEAATVSVRDYVIATYGAVTVSSSAPSGGADGDTWYVV